MKALHTLYCLFTGNCDSYKKNRETLEETERLITSLEDAWEPIKTQIREDAKTRPTIADKLREAHDVVNHHGRSSN